MKSVSFNCIFYFFCFGIIIIINIICYIMYNTKAPVTHNACWNKGRTLLCHYYWCH